MAWALSVTWLLSSSTTLITSQEVLIMRIFYVKAVVVLIAGATVASACSSGGEESGQVEAAQPETVESTEVESTTTAAPITSTTAPEADTSTTSAEPAPQIMIEGAVSFGPNVGTGTWEVTKGAELLGCDGGTMEEFDAQDAVAGELTCDGERSGAFVGLFTPAGGGSTFTSSWDVIAASGDFDDMSGLGNWSGEIDADGEQSRFTVTLDVTFGEVAAPVDAFPRLVQSRATQCWDGFVTSNGLIEYATVDDTMVRLDLETGETSEHGAPPSECAWWLGDPELGRRVALSLPDGDMALPNGEIKAWLGPYDGAWDVELSYDEVTLLLSRSMTANRLLLSQPDSGSVVLIDATTGVQIGSAIEGNFANGRHSVATATSTDGRFIALGGASTSSMTGVGELVVLDAATGDQLARIETEDPPTALAFDADGNELVVGLFTGAILTIDMAAIEVVSEVSLVSTAVIASLGIRPDGLIVVATGVGAEVLDRRTGPSGAKIDMRHSGASRIRPDGTINSITNFQRFELYEIAG